MSHISTLVSNEVRKALAATKELAAGNFLPYALANSPAPDAPIISLEKPLRTFFGWEGRYLSLNQLDQLSSVYARWYKAQGVQAGDPVGVYLDDGVEYLIHYLALVQLGAIGVLTNGNMESAIAAGHFKAVGVVGVFTDESHVTELAINLGAAKLAFLTTDRQLDGQSVEALPTFDRHVFDADDPIMIAHSSGTTGIPKPVLLQHERFFHGVRYRLGIPRISGGEKILSSLPHSHNCAISYIMLALLSGTPVYVASDHSGPNVLRRIEEFRPTMVVSFPQSYVELTDCPLEGRDLRSVNLWFNGGDAAHETHIRKLVALGSHVEEGQVVPGSIFIDGMGSSEMGFSLFRNVHTVKTNNYGRCVGTPLEWVDAQVLSEAGEKLPPFVVGRLGVKAPSVTTGYWNNSLLTYKSRLRGYFLTGDLAYRDDQGRFFHVDRTPDLIRTARGVMYGLQTEEFLMARFPEISDVAVFGLPHADGAHRAVAMVRLRPEHATASPALKERLGTFNEALAQQGLQILDRVDLVTLDQVPLGTTGKVLKRRLRQLADQQPAAHA